MKLSIIIPVFNEKETIEEVIQRVIKAPTLDYEKEIIVINDGSTDGTEAILEKIKKEIPILVFHHHQNLGKGAAIKTGIEKATGDLILIQDADLEYDPQDYQRILEAFEKDKNLVVYGSRNIKLEKRGYLHYFLGARFLTFLVNFLFKAKLTDVFTCYKLIPLSMIKSLNLESKSFEIEAEITVKILKKGIKIIEVPISYHPRKFAQGKKIRIWHGLKSLFVILKNLN